MHIIFVRRFLDHGTISLGNFVLLPLAASIGIWAMKIKIKLCAKNIPIVGQLTRRIIRFYLVKELMWSITFLSIAEENFEKVVFLPLSAEGISVNNFFMYITSMCSIYILVRVSYQYLKYSKTSKIDVIYLNRYWIVFSNFVQLIVIWNLADEGHLVIKNIYNCVNNFSLFELSLPQLLFPPIS